MDLHLRCFFVLHQWVWWMGQGGDGGWCGDAEMGANLPVVDLGPGRSAIAVVAGDVHTCVLLVQ
jgi:hypothetical protein